MSVTAVLLGSVSLHVSFQDYFETVDYLGLSRDFSPSDISKTLQLTPEVSTWMKTLSTAGENMLNLGVNCPFKVLYRYFLYMIS